MKFLHLQPYKSLTTIGAWEEKVWPDYIAQYGFNDTHIPRLIQLATHWPYLQADESADEYWLPVHAWRTLAQLKAETAVSPLLDQMDRLKQVDHHFSMEEIPTVLAQIGTVSFHFVEAYLTDERHTMWARIVVAAIPAELAKWHPELAGRCADLIASQLAPFALQCRDYNSFLVGQLVDLNAVQHIDLINAAFRADRVDLGGGDWQEVHIKLGLLDERLTPPVPWQLVSNQSDFIEWRQLAATAYEGEDTLSRFLRAHRERELLGNVN